MNAKMTKETFKLSEEITIYDSKVKNIVALIIEKKQLEVSYGSLSCLDYPEAYDRMEELSSEIDEAIREEYGENINSQYNNIYFRDIKEQLECIAFDAYNNKFNITECDIHFYDQYEFIATYVCSGFDKGQLETFLGLFRFMDSDSRGVYLTRLHLDSEEGHYYTRMADFVFIVG
jgi:hypothetical protein